MLDKKQKPTVKLNLNQKEPRKIKTYLLMAGVGAIALIIGAVGTWLLLNIAFPRTNPLADTKTASPKPQPQAAATPAASDAPVLDVAKAYGNKYANNLLPVGDGKYSSTTAQKGSVFVCSAYAQNLISNQGGADTRGPWFTNNNTQYDISKKPHVQGSVSWKGAFANTIAGDKRTITTNDLPLTHTTGTFPISRTDPAYTYDHNPNTISTQSLTYTLNATPAFGSPQCMGGEVGVMLTGVAIFNAFDAGGRDAGAWEVQDDCSGHPQEKGEYHYHTLSSCIADTSVHTVIGFALDGFPITGPQVSAGNVLTTSDLDDCHGITSQIMLDGKQVTMYHYVMTQDFPYSVSCFHSTAANPPGMPGGTGAQSTQQSQTQPPAQGSAGSQVGVPSANTPPQAPPIKPQA